MEVEADIPSLHGPLATCDLGLDNLLNLTELGLNLQKTRGTKPDHWEEKDSLYKELSRIPST